MSAPRHDPSQYVDRDQIAIRRALISVSDKTGLVQLARTLAGGGVEIVSTGSTAQTIRDAGIAVTEVSAVTGFPESLDGRVKTLHPAVHAGILADLRLESHADQLADLGIEAFQLVVVNLYPFAETVASGAEGDDVIEQIDIGGPALVRASAKNHANVAVVVSPKNYPSIERAVGLGGTTLVERRRLAAAAFEHTARYDAGVASWFTGASEGFDPTNPLDPSGFPDVIDRKVKLSHGLRYGENAHQQAALYVEPYGRGVAQAEQLNGKEMSYNNFVDADAAIRAAFDFRAPAVAIIKHANPCGIAIASSTAIDPIASAHLRAHECDPVSAFGGVIAANRTVTLAMAEAVQGIFTEVLVAPDFDSAALKLLQTKKNLRILRLPSDYASSSIELRQISGGVLAQTTDSFEGYSTEGWTHVTGEAASPELLLDLEFAWKACRAVKSNAILLAVNGASVGVGMGQVNRVDSCRLAVSRAGARASGAVAASDAYFPFADGLQVLIDAGVRAVVQPGGSVRDEEVIEAAEAAGVTMYFTGERHFFH